MEYHLLKQLPKAVLHDHLDGGLRVATVIELADATGYAELPSRDPDELAAWFHQGESGSLERYLESFAHTFGVMQTAEGLERVAYEAVVDLAADGVVYAELRFAPALHTRLGLAPDEIIEATLGGLRRGRDDTGLAAYLIVDALRQDDDSEFIAAVAARYAGEGVVGFDLAGPEAGNPADRHLAACRHAREHGLGLTIHAGEGDGPESIWRAVGRCAAQRIGHGVRIIEDTKVEDGEIVEVGALARYVRDLRVPLEVAPSSNLHTGAFPSAEAHPLGRLYRAGFNVTINTDNRLMSGIELTDEFALAADTFGFTVADLRQITEQTILAGFGDWPTRARLIDEVVRPAYAGAAS